MNHIYRLVWNRVTHQWVAAAETARGRRGGAGATVDGRPAAPLRALLALSVALACGGPAWAAPQGGQVVSGSGTIGQAGATTTIRQDSNRLSLNWQSFNVGVGETVRFVQPNARAIAVNRVLGSAGSEILGRVQANGNVWLLNPNGILFGQDAQVNVGGLVASTLLAPDSQLGRATTRFEASPGKAGAGVVNRGSIQAADGGYVALLGHTVSNRGSIVAPGGTVALGAGRVASLTFADHQLVKLQIDEGTLNDLVENRQLIQADGGRVFLSAGARDSVLASVVNNSGVVQARTVENRGGTIVLLGGMAAGTTKVGGTLDASAPDGGNGGFIETSAHVVDVAPGAVLTTRAARGASGTWLIDPADYTIAASGGNQTPTQLAAALAAGNVTIASAAGSNAATGTGSIFVNDNVSWSSANTLTLNAANNVEVNAVLAATGNGGLTINTASALSGGSPVAGGRLNVNMANGGRVDLTAASPLSINGNAYTVITSNTALAAVPTSGFFALGANLTGTNLPDIGINTPQNAFLGSFNGLGHAINATGTANREASMFYSLAPGSVVENLAITNAAVRGVTRLDIGILTTTNAGTVRNVSTSGTVSGGATTLGVGGLVAVNNGSITQSSSSADVSSTNTSTGPTVGGLAGFLQSGGSIDASYATGSVTASSNSLVGGLVGYATDVAGTGLVSITRSFATGDVSARNGSTAGGLVGYMLPAIRVSDSYATGSVTGDVAGGLVGITRGIVERVYASGAVSKYRSSSVVGGLIGDVGVTTASNAYWNTSGTGQATSPAGTALSAAQSRQRASYAGFDFAGSDPTWVIYEGHTAPLLNAFLKPLTVTSGNQASVVYNAAGSTASLIGPTYSDSGAPTSGHLFGTNAAYADRVNAGTYTPNLWSDQFGYRIGYTGGSLTITPATLTLTGSRAYDGSTVAAASTLSSNGTVAGLGGQTLQLSGSGTLGGKDFGTQSLGLGSLTLADGTGLASNYTLSTTGNYYTIVQAVINLTGSRAYDTGTTAGNALFTSGGTLAGVAGETLTLSGSGTVSGKDAGTRTLASRGTLALGDGTGSALNYTLAGGLHTVTIDKAVIDLSGTRTYDGGTTAAAGIFGTSGTIAGLGGETLTVSGSGSISDKNAGFKLLGLGTLALNNGGNGGLAGNYTLAGGTHQVTVNRKAVTGSFVAAGKTYDATTAATVTGSVSGLLGSDAVVLSGTGTFADKNAGNGKAVSIAGTSVTGADAGNYLVTTVTAGVTANIGKRAITGSFAAADKTYDATTAATVTGNLNGVLGTDAVTLGGAGTFANKNAGNGKAVTVTSSGLSGNDAGNYTVTAGTTGVTASIGKRAITGSYTAADKTYDATTVASVTGTLTGVLGTDVVTLGGTGAFVDKNAGTGKAVTIAGSSVTGADAGNYTVTATTTGVTADIARRAITGSFTAADKTYDATTAASITGSLTGVLGTDAVTLGGTGAFANKNAGTGKAVTVTSTGLGGADAGNYTVTAGTTGVTATIARRAITGSFTAADKVYDATTAAAVTGNLSGVLGTDAVTLGGTGTFANKNAGNGKAVTVTSNGLSGTDAGNYTVTAGTGGVTADIARRAISGSFTAAGKTYDATTAASVTGTLSGVLGTDAVSLGGTGAFANKNAGTGKAVTVTSTGLSGADAGNYTVTASTTGVTADIARRAVSGSFAAADKVYDATTAATVTGNLTGVLGTDAVTLGGTGNFADKNAGNGKAVAITSNGLSGTDAGNYVVTAATTGVTANIARRGLTASYTASGKVYDGTTAASVTGSLTGVLGTDAVALSGTGTFADKNAGNGKAVTIAVGGLTGADAGNYAVTASTTGVTADIARRGITGNFTAADKIYDATTAATVTGNLSGVLGTDAVVLSGTGTFAGKNAGNAKAVTVTSNGLSGTDAGNYTVTASTGGVTANIGKRAITGSYTANGKTYDATTVASVTGTLTGVLGTDAVTLGGTGTFVDKNAGTGKAVTIAGSSVTGADAGNYTVTATTTGVTADIAKRGITASYTAADKTYDATTAATVTGSLSGVLGSDAVTLSGTGTFADKNVGTGKAVTIASGGLAGADAGNYTVTSSSTSVTASIGKRAITGSYTAADKTYDATAVASVTGTLTGVLGTDAVTLSGTGTFSDKNAGTGKAVAIAGSSVTGADAGNYTVTASTTGVTADIARRAISGSFTAADKVYDATTAASITGSLTGVLGTDAVTLGGTGAFANKNAGTGKTVTVTSTGLGGADAGNYTVTASTTGVTADIARRAINGSFAAADKVYDATTAATVTGNLSGVLGTDAVALSGTGAFANKNAGNGKAVTVTSTGLSGADAGNYTVTASTTGVTADIARRAISGSFAAADKVYDATTAATVTGSLAGVLGTDSVTLSGTGSFADKNAGNGKAVAITSNGLSGADAGNYVVTAAATGVTADIARRAITGRFAAADKVYDGTTAASVTGTLDGVLAGDAVSLSGTGAFADKNAGSGKALVIGGTAVTGTDAGNYSVTTATTGVTADIARRGINGAFTAADKTYDATTVASVTGTLTGVLRGDAVALTGTGRFADKHAGRDKDVTVTGMAVTGADARNYAVAIDGATTASITPKSLVLLGAKPFDGSTAARAGVFGDGGSLAGVGNETVQLSGTGTLASARPGRQALASLGSLALADGQGGGRAGNYRITADGASVLVGDAPVTPPAPAPTPLLPAGAQAAVSQAQSVPVSRDQLTADGLDQADGPSRSSTAGGNTVAFILDPADRAAGTTGSQVALRVVDGGVRLPADALCVDGACGTTPSSPNPQAR